MIRTVARSGDGVDALADAMGAHASWMHDSGCGVAHTHQRQRLELASRVEQAYRAAALLRIESAEFDVAATRVSDGLSTVSEALHSLMDIPPI